MKNTTILKCIYVLGLECGNSATATVTPQSAFTPGYHDNHDYPNSHSCDWTISAAPGYSVEIEFQDISVEMCFDYILIGKVKRSILFLLATVDLRDKFLGYYPVSTH